MDSFPVVVFTKKTDFFIYAGRKCKSGSAVGTDFQISVSQWHSKTDCQGAQVKSELVLCWVSLESFYGQGKEKKENKYLYSSWSLQLWKWLVIIKSGMQRVLTEKNSNDNFWHCLCLLSSLIPLSALWGSFGLIYLCNSQIFVSWHQTYS